MNEKEESAGRDDSGEDSFNVSTVAFSRPVRPVFVTSDVSIKTRATTRNRPPPDDPTATTTPVLRWDQCYLSPATLPQTPSVFLPLPSDTLHTHQKAVLSAGVTLQT